MISSQKIMKKKGRFKAEIDRRLPKAQSDALWQKATDRLAALLEQYSSLSDGVRFHTENKIFPAAAIYLTLKESIGQDDAYRVIEDATFKTADAAAKKLSALLRLPGMRSLFVFTSDAVAVALPYKAVRAHTPAVILLLVTDAVGFLIEGVVLCLRDRHLLTGTANVDEIGLLIVIVLHNESPPSAFAEMESSRHAKPDHRREGIPKDYSISAAPHFR